MKVWTKVRIKDQNPQVERVSRSFVNYLYGYGPFYDFCRKYNVSLEDRHFIEQYTGNRISGLLLLFLSRDYTRINDIANKYNIDATQNVDIYPEIEGYIEK
ncbi:MAG: hypothetical protein J6X28_05670 [Bacilli bacterium]|nr:hypothetical protein [Bacilli bacterium]